MRAQPDASLHPFRLVPLLRRLKDDPVKKPFWRKLENRGVQPIDRTEVEGSQVGCCRSCRDGRCMQIM